MFGDQRTAAAAQAIRVDPDLDRQASRQTGKAGFDDVIGTVRGIEGEGLRQVVAEELRLGGVGFRHRVRGLAVRRRRAERAVARRAQRAQVDRLAACEVGRIEIVEDLQIVGGRRRDIGGHVSTCRVALDFHQAAHVGVEPHLADQAVVGGDASRHLTDREYAGDDGRWRSR